MLRGELVLLGLTAYVKAGSATVLSQLALATRPEQCCGKRSLELMTV